MPEFPKSKIPKSGLAQPAQTPANHGPNAPRLFDMRPEILQGARRAKDVFGFEKAGYFGPSLRERAEDQRAVRNGFVSRHRKGPVNGAQNP